MEELVLMLGIVYTFVVGYVFARKADKFMSKHPRAFPRRRRIIAAAPPVWRGISNDDPAAFRKPDNESEEKQKHETRNS